MDSMKDAPHMFFPSLQSFFDKPLSQVTPGQIAMVLAGFARDRRTKNDPRPTTVVLADHYKEHGVTPQDIGKARTVFRHSTPDIIQAVRNGTMSLTEACRRNTGVVRTDTMTNAGVPGGIKTKNKARNGIIVNNCIRTMGQSLESLTAAATQLDGEQFRELSKIRHAITRVLRSADVRTE